jgi:methionyl-tRNA formyltransferase
MRIAFLGLPLAALLLHADGHDIVIAGLRNGLTLGQRRLATGLGHDRLVVDPHHDWAAFQRRVRDLRPDLLVSWFFTRRIPMGVVEACALGGIGVHPSLLPRHRGPDPFFAALDAGDEVTGVTVHRIEESYDTGAILAQRSLSIDPWWNAWDLARALDRPSLALLRETVATFAAGEPILAVPQDESKATQAPFPAPEQRVLRWTWPAEAIVRRVRALAPNPGALAFPGDAPLVVLEVEVRPVHAVLEPGEAAVIDGVAVVRAADHGVALLRGEVDGHVWGPEAIAHQIASSVVK